MYRLREAMEWSGETEIASSIQIQLDRANLIPTFTDQFNALSLDLEKGSPQGGGWRTNFRYGGVNSFTLVNNGELEVYVDPLFSGTGTTSLNLQPFQIVDDLQVASKSTPEDFHQPMYMPVNLAVCGAWPGAPDSSTRFPVKYAID